MSAAPQLAHYSRCLSCNGSGWRYVSKNRVVRCECRKGKDRPDLAVIDQKSNAAGEK